jgi:O-antigen/teichoic acid export membrane protein
MKSVDITSLLVLSSFVAIIGLPYANLVTGSGKLKQATTIAMISVVFYTGLLYTFISDWGLDLGGLGLAYTVFILQVFNAVAYHLYSRVHFHYDNDFENVKYVLLGSAMYLLLSVAYRLTSAGIFQLVVIPIFFVALFYGIASNMKLFGKADINELIQLVNAKGIHSYTKEELQNDSK